MKFLVLVVLLFLMFSCQSDDKLDPENPDQPEFTGVSSYNPENVPQPTASLPNLLEDSGFESDGEWVLCGDASIQAVTNPKEGDKVAILGNGSICEKADKPFFTARNAILTQRLEIQELPDLLTVSFWVRSDTEIPEDAFKLYIANSAENFFSIGGAALVSHFDEHSISGDWSWIKLYYKKENSLFISNNAPLSLVFQLEPPTSYTGDIRLFIDQVKVSDGDEDFTQPLAMPENLLRYSGNSEILFLNHTSETVSSMQPNGDNVVNYQVPIDHLSGIPNWYANTGITVPKITFNPENPQNVNVIPASGSEVFNYPVDGGNGELIYRTQGDPGYYEAPSHPDNEEALDIEVRRVAWDMERNRGAFTTCGRNRLQVVTSDDVCNITIISTDNYAKITEIKNGYNPVWSSSGRLAY